MVCLMHKIKTASIDELVMIDALVDNYFQNKEERYGSILF